MQPRPISSLRFAFSIWSLDHSTSHALADIWWIVARRLKISQLESETTVVIHRAVAKSSSVCGNVMLTEQLAVNHRLYSQATFTSFSTIIIMNNKNDIDLSSFTWIVCSWQEGQNIECVEQKQKQKHANFTMSCTAWERLSHRVVLFI